LPIRQKAVVVSKEFAKVVTLYQTSPDALMDASPISSLVYGVSTVELEDGGAGDGVRPRIFLWLVWKFNDSL
jgi:hypothetical protein